MAGNFFTLTCLLITISSWQPASAGNIGKPVIAMSRIGCGGFYLLEIFENSDVELRSSERWKLGIYKSRINKEKLDALIKRFFETDFMSANNMQPGLALDNSVIRFRYGNQVATVFFQSGYARPEIINQLADDIIQETSMTQRLPIFKNCAGNNLGVMFEKLKVK